MSKIVQKYMNLRNRQNINFEKLFPCVEKLFVKVELCPMKLENKMFSSEASFIQDSIYWHHNVYVDDALGLKNGSSHELDKSLLCINSFTLSCDSLLR